MYLRSVAKIFRLLCLRWEIPHVKQLVETKNILLSTRYVDDILIIRVYDTTKTHPHTINEYINQINHKKTQSYLRKQHVYKLP